MNVVDIVLLVAAVWFAVVGYRQGFVVGILSVIGFLGGGLVAVYTLPVIWDAATNNARRSAPPPPSSPWSSSSSAPPSARPLTTHLGNKLRRYITWSHARRLDATGGALVNVVAMLLVAWLIGTALAGSTLPTLRNEVRGSQVLHGVRAALPRRGRHLVRRLLRRSRAERLPAGLQPLRQRAHPRRTAARPGPGEQPGRPARPALHRQGDRHRPELRQGSGGHRLRLRRPARDDQRARRRRGRRAPRADRRRGPQVRREGRPLRLEARHRGTRRTGPEGDRAAVHRAGRGRRRRRDRRGLPRERGLRRARRARARAHRGRRRGHLPPRHGPPRRLLAVRHRPPGQLRRPPCSRRTARCTAWCSRSPSTTRTPGTPSRWTRSGPTSSGDVRRTSRWVRTAAPL